MSLSHKDEGQPQALNQSPEPQASSLSLLPCHGNINVMSTLGPETLRCTGAKKYHAAIVSEPVRPQLEAYVLLGWQGSPKNNNSITTTAWILRPFQGPDASLRWAGPPPPAGISQRSTWFRLQSPSSLGFYHPELVSELSLTWELPPETCHVPSCCH